MRQWGHDDPGARIRGVKRVSGLRGSMASLRGKEGQDVNEARRTMGVRGFVMLVVPRSDSRAGTGDTSSNPSRGPGWRRSERWDELSSWAQRRSITLGDI